MNLGQLDYPRLDKQIDFHYKEDLKKALERLGFSSISKAVATLYFEKELPCYRIAALFEVNKGTVNRWMAKWGMKRRPHNGGGLPYPYSRFCKDCNCDTVEGYRVAGRCWNCYQANYREKQRLKRRKS